MLLLIAALTLAESLSGSTPVSNVAGNPLVVFSPLFFLPLTSGVTTSSDFLSPNNPTTPIFLFLACCDTLSDLTLASNLLPSSCFISLALTPSDPLALGSNNLREARGIEIPNFSASLNRSDLPISLKDLGDLMGLRGSSVPSPNF